MKKLSKLFDVTYGNKFDLNKMEHLPLSAGGIHFVGRSSENHGVSSTVSPLPRVPPYAEGLITVALGGSKLLSAFVQERPFYTAQNVAVLKPLAQMTFAEKLFMCLCIRHNRFRYSAFGREANRTLRDLPVPEPSDFPRWISADASAVSRIDALDAPCDPREQLDLEISSWRWFNLGDLFDLKKGRRLTKAQMALGSTPFIGAVDNNNGVTAYVAQAALHPANTITVNYNGNGVAEAFYQPAPFRCSDDVNVLYPKFDLNPFIALFFTTILRREKYRFSYGRKWHLERMQKAEIRLPARTKHEPDFAFMETYAKRLPFSSQVT
jgi:hypothetical protein